jgi:hypothetical protein
MVFLNLSFIIFPQRALPEFHYQGNEITEFYQFVFTTTEFTENRTNYLLHTQMRYRGSLHRPLVLHDHQPKEAPQIERKTAEATKRRLANS